MHLRCGVGKGFFREFDFNVVDVAHRVEENP